MKTALIAACFSLALCSAEAQVVSASAGQSSYSGQAASSEKAPVPPAGQESLRPFRGANTIVVRTPETPAEAFRRCGAALVANGYSFAQKDNELLYIQCLYRPLSAGNTVRLAPRVVVVPSGTGAMVLFSATIQNAIADMMVNGATQLTAPISYGSDNRVRPTWAEMARVAEAGPGVVSYKQMP